MISVLLPQSKKKKNQKKKPQLFKHFSNPQIINRLVNIMLGTNIIISHEYFFLSFFFFAVMCKSRGSVQLLRQLLVSTVSQGFFFHSSPPPLQQQHIVKRKKHKRPESVCPRINWLWWAPLGWSLAALDEERSWAPWLQLETSWTRRWPRALVYECAAARSKHLSESEEFRKRFIVKWIQVSHWRSFKFLSWSYNWQQDLDCDSEGTHIHQWQRTTKPRRRHSKNVFQLCHHSMSGSRCRVRPHQRLRQICSHKAKFYQTKHHLCKQSLVTELPAAFINKLCCSVCGTLCSDLNKSS